VLYIYCCLGLAAQQMGASTHHDTEKPAHTLPPAHTRARSTHTHKGTWIDGQPRDFGKKGEDGRVAVEGDRETGDNSSKWTA